MRYFLYVILSLLPALSCGQAAFQALRNMFPKPNADVEVLVLKGYFNHVHPMEFFLGVKEQQVHGFFRLISSGDTIYVSGEKDKDMFFLEETNTNLKKSQLTFRWNKNIEALWENEASHEVFLMHLKPVNYGDFIFKNQSRFIGVFEHKSRKKDLSVVFEELDDDRAQISLVWNDKRHNEQVQLTKKENHTVFTVQKWSHPMFFKWQGEQLSFSLDRKKYWPCEMLYNANSRSTRYAKKNFLTDIEYILTKNKSYNQWIRTLVKNTRLTKQLDVNQFVQSKGDSLHHFACQWTGWQEIDYLSEKVLSGRMVFYESWTNRTKTIPIVYAFDEETVIDVKVDFTDISTINQLIQHVLDKKIPIEKTNIQSNESLLTIPFSTFNLAKGCIVVSTDFSPVFGYKKIFIPYKSIKNMIKSTSFIHQVILS